jgi:hypothetical protein
MACGGTGSENEELLLVQSASEIANDTQDILDRVGVLSISPNANIPTSGTAVFSGTLAGVVFLPTEPGDPATFLGNADVTTNFFNNTLSGTARNFVGVSGGADSDLVGYSGTVVISGGDFGGADRSAVTGNVSGTLSSQDDVIAINGPIAGVFLGDDAEALRMISSTTGVIDVNGTAAVGGLELVTER